MKTIVLLLCLLWASFAVGKDLYLIKIFKSAYKLEVYKNNVKTHTFKAVFGNPIGDKYKEGDRKTPIGSYKIKAKYPHKSWAYFLWIDYPNATSWQRFKLRKANGQLSQNAKIGGSIGIHGVPQGYDNYISSRTNWTLGCISLTRSDIATLYSIIPVGTEVLIYE